MIFEEKAKKFKIALVVSWVMFVVLLILSTRFGKSKSGRGVCHNGMYMYVIIQTCIITFVLYSNCTTYSVLQVTIYDTYEVVLLLYVETFDGDNVNGQVDEDFKFCCYICMCVYIYIYVYIFTLCQQLIVRVLGFFFKN